MKRIMLILALALTLCACQSDYIENPEQPPVTTAEVTASSTPSPTEKDTPKAPDAFNAEVATTVEDYYGGDVLYKADFDGDGKADSCTVKIVAHGTQCYVEEILITDAFGEKIIVEHPVTATGMRSDLYKFEDSYSIFLHAGEDDYTEFVYPFEKLGTLEKNLIPPMFGDIFDYSVAGDKLFFRGSLACGMSEVLGDIIYEYSYIDGALKISRIGYQDYIDGGFYDLGEIEPTAYLLVEPCKKDNSVAALPEKPCIVESRAIMSNPTFLVYDEGLTYYVKQYTSATNDEYTVKKYTLAGACPGICPDVIIGPDRLIIAHPQTVQ